MDTKTAALSCSSPPTVILCGGQVPCQVMCAQVRQLNNKDSEVG
jgi:hypothetical protein